MNFRTELHPAPADYKLNLASKVVTVGSCFSEVIGSQVERYKVETLTNPFGVLFNPLSACKLLQACAGADVELADSLVENNGRWYSYDFHSSFSAETEEALYEKLDEAIVNTRRFLKQADVLILTLGTANIYRLNITGETVANCHKLPAANFTRETLLPEEIINAIAETHSLLRELNPKLKLVLTVSPVRHIKDSLELNNVSKAVLRLATHFLSQNLPETAYFPAYELLIDDLRDYRFFKEDLIHPTAAAENYIWEKFAGAYFEPEFLAFTRKWDTVLRAKAHKPFHPESAQHQAFVRQTLEKLRTLQETVNVTEEISFFENQVIVQPEPLEAPEPEEEEGLEAAEEETIPGYFSEETETAETEMEEADLEGTPATALTEESVPLKKKKKKPRKKKKKPAISAEAAQLSEVGTAAIPAETHAGHTPTETVAEVLEELAEPQHDLAHYGETLSEAPVEQVKTAAPARSKSAKRRDSRRKKKALAALEQVSPPEISEEVAILLQPEETVLPASEQTFSTENLSVLEDKTAKPAQIQAETEPEKEQGIPAKKPAKKGRKKNAFKELFAVETRVEMIPTAEIPGEPSPASPMAIPQAAPETLQPEPVQKRRGRPKKEQPVASTEPSSVVAPFVDEVTLTEIASAETSETTSLPAASEKSKTRKPSARKTTTKAKPETKPKAADNPKSPRPGRKKKPAPEA